MERAAAANSTFADPEPFIEKKYPLLGKAGGDVGDVS